MDGELFNLAQVTEMTGRGFTPLFSGVKDGSIPVAHYDGSAPYVTRETVHAIWTATRLLREATIERVCTRKLEAQWEQAWKAVGDRALTELEIEARQQETAHELAILRAIRASEDVPRPHVYGLSNKDALRLLAIWRDGYICQLCARPVDPAHLDIDHIIPRSKGGRDTLDNVRVAHPYCNRSRGNRDDWARRWYYD